MIVYYGTRLFGKVDQIDDTDVHVATKFFHIYWVPLIPLGSSLVFEKTDDGWRGVELPMSFKSVLVAWMRFACIPGVIAGIALLVEEEWLAGIPLIVGSLAFFIGSYWLFVARGKRREELLARMGVREEPEVVAPMPSAPMPSAPMPAPSAPSAITLLVPPEVGPAGISASLQAAGFAQTQAPPGALAQFANPQARITALQGPLGLVALKLEGPSADQLRHHLAPQLRPLDPQQVNWLLQHQDPSVRAHAQQLMA